MTTLKQARVVDQKDLTRVFIRQFFLQTSWNYERMQAAGYLYIILPVLKKIYKDNPERLQRAVKRNLEFFNTQPYLAAPIIGVALALEEQLGVMEDEKEIVAQENAISAVKVSMMGPFAGVGDSMFWFTIRPIAMGIGISLAESGNILGPIAFLVIFNIFHLGTRYYGTTMSYDLGTKFVERLAKEGIVQRVSEAAAVLGLMVLGVMIAQMVKVPFNFSIGTGDAAKKFTDITNSIMPNIVPLGLTFLLSQWLRKGVTPIRILLIVIAFSLVGAFFGFLG